MGRYLSRLDWRPYTKESDRTMEPENPMTSPDITPQDLAHWEATRKECGDFGFTAVHAEFPRLLTAYERVVRELDALKKLLTCSTCGGSPPVSGLPCVCEGHNTPWAENEGLQAELFRSMQENDRLTAQLATAREDHQRIRGDYDRECGRLTAQLAIEQTASTRTIEHLVARKDALEARVAEVEGERAAALSRRDALLAELNNVWCDDANCAYWRSPEKRPTP